MPSCASLTTIRAMFPNLVRGLWVLGIELRWTFGADAEYMRHISSLRKRRSALLSKIESASPASPDVDKLRSELSLLEEDLDIVIEERAETHRKRLDSLRRRFPDLFD